VTSAWERPSDRWVARGLSAALHGALLFVLGSNLVGPAPKTQVIFSVETVSGLTPRGDGSGAEGTASQISNVPANPNPLAGGLRLTAADAPVPPPQPKAQPKPVASSAPVAAAPPSLDDLQQRYEALPIGVRPRDGRSGEEPSEGGMGNARTAGAEGGVLGLDGAIAGRGYRIGDYSFGRALPEESEVALLVTVSPRGEVLEARIKLTSGHPELDQHALTKAREIVFDPVPPTGLQDPVTGTVLFRFEYSGRSR
jgi:TonB family protein